MTSEGDKAEIITPINPVKQKEQQNHGGNSMASFHFSTKRVKMEMATRHAVNTCKDSNTTTTDRSLPSVPVGATGIRFNRNRKKEEKRKGRGRDKACQ